MSTELMLVDHSIDPYMTWLDQVPTEVQKFKASDITSSMKILRQVELLEIGSRKMKIRDLTVKASVTKLNLMRDIGRQLDKLFGVKISEADYAKYSLTKTEVFQYRQIGAMPDYQWERMLLRNPVLAEALREAKRYFDIVGLIENSPAKDKKGLLKSYILEGIGTDTVMSRIRGARKLRVNPNWVGAGEDEDSEVFKKKKPEKVIRSKQAQDNIFMTEYIDNGKTIADTLMKEAEYIAGLDGCTKRQMMMMRRVTKRMRDAIDAVVESLKGLTVGGESDD